MPLSPREFDKLVAPWKDWQPPPLSVNKTVKRLDRQVRATAALGDAGRFAAVGLIVAVGNYEWLGRRSAKVIAKANKLLDEFGDPEHSWRWG